MTEEFTGIWDDFRIFEYFTDQKKMKKIDILFPVSEFGNLLTSQYLDLHKQ